MTEANGRTDAIFQEIDTEEEQIEKVSDVLGKLFIHVFYPYLNQELTSRDATKRPSFPWENA